ncbi:MAG: hypothetical protein HYY24_25685 [Verrucomicrobia bacterium]|nr:hypothetical protein [Verrucomicrobiota bacterium]
MLAIEKGAFPWLSDDLVKQKQVAANTRIMAAWARALTRVAILLGDPPEEWARGCGLLNFPGLSEDAILKTVRDAADRLRRDKRTGQLESLSSGAKILERIKRTSERTRKAVRVGILEYPPFSVGEKGQSFFEQVAQRVVGSINPEWEIENLTPPVDAGRISHFVDELVSLPPTYDLVMGLFETLYRRGRGIDFVSLPGWKINLSAVHLCPRGTSEGDALIPRWENICRPKGNEPFHVLVIKEEAGYLFMKGPCHFSAWPTHLHEQISTRSPSELAEALEDAAKKFGWHRVVLVADEETCRVIMHEFNSRREFEAREAKGAPENCPKYDLTIAFPSGNPEWRELIQAAVSRELFSNAFLVTAELYAQVMVHGCFLLGRESGRIRSTWRPYFFPLESPHVTLQFWVEVFKRSYERAKRENAALDDKNAWDVAASLMPPEIGLGRSGTDSDKPALTFGERAEICQAIKDEIEKQKQASAAATKRPTSGGRKASGQIQSRTET